MTALLQQQSVYFRANLEQRTTIMRHAGFIHTRSSYKRVYLAGVDDESKMLCITRRAKEKRSQQTPAPPGKHTKVADIHIATENPANSTEHMRVLLP